jgi:hypothetical protein
VKSWRTENREGKKMSPERALEVDDDDWEEDIWSEVGKKGDFISVMLPGPENITTPGR